MINNRFFFFLFSPAVIEVLLLVVVPLPVLLVLLRRHRRHRVRELLRPRVKRQLRESGDFIIRVSGWEKLVSI